MKQLLFLGILRLSVMPVWEGGISTVSANTVGAVSAAVHHTCAVTAEGSAVLGPQ